MLYFARETALLQKHYVLPCVGAKLILDQLLKVAASGLHIQQYALLSFLMCPVYIEREWSTHLVMWQTLLWTTLEPLWHLPIYYTSFTSSSLVTLLTSELDNLTPPVLSTYNYQQL